MRFRWPLVRRRRLESALAALDAATDYVADLSDEVRDCHEHIATLDAEIARLRSKNREFFDVAFERGQELIRLRAAPIPTVAPFWLGLPNEILSLIVTTNMDGVQATLGGLGHDEESDDPRVNPTLPFALKPL